MQAQKYPIKSWAYDDRPREKLLRKSPAALSDSELLAILIRHGTKGRNALELAQEILQMGKNSLDQLGRLSLFEMMQVRGIGEAKAITLAAALELGKRRQRAGFLLKRKIKSSLDVVDYLQSVLGDLNHEVLGVLYLNNANKINHFHQVSQGGIAATVADPRIIFKLALEAGATGMILCHNHPSGSLEPSTADLELTQKIRDGARLLDIRLMDHVIVSNEGYFSFADKGRL